MKKIVIPPDGNHIFRMLFEGFHIFGKPSTREEHKISNRILDVLEGVSTAEDGPVGGFANDPESPRKRTLNPDGAECFFENNEFEYLKKVMGTLQMLPARSRDIEAMWEVLDAATTYSAKDLAAKATNG